VDLTLIQQNRGPIPIAETRQHLERVVIPEGGVNRDVLEECLERWLADLFGVSPVSARKDQIRPLAFVGAINGVEITVQVADDQYAHRLHAPTSTSIGPRLELNRKTAG
jgi:hypothetical protein